MSKQATLKHFRMTQRKIQPLARAIRGVKVAKALDYLQLCKRKAAKPLAKLLKSAVVNASQEKGVDIDNLVVKTVLVNSGPTMKRWLPRAKGSASPILKRTSHITVILGEK